MLSGLTRWQAGLVRALTQTDRPPDYDERLMRELVGADVLPEVHAAVVEGVFGPGGDDPFAFALERALDGIQHYIDRLAQKGRPVKPSTPDVVDDQSHPRDAQLKQATRDRREAERRLRELHRRGPS